MIIQSIIVIIQKTTVMGRMKQISKQDSKQKTQADVQPKPKNDFKFSKVTKQELESERIPGYGLLLA